MSTPTIKGLSTHISIILDALNDYKNWWDEGDETHEDIIRAEKYLMELKIG